MPSSPDSTSDHFKSSLALANPAALRKALGANSPAKIERGTLQASSVQLVDTILTQPINLVHKEVKAQLTELHASLEGIFDYAGVPDDLRKRRFLHQTGVAISPQHALGTIRDVFRVSSFVRALDQAIETLKSRFDEKLHIIYPACGPLAPLALLLLIYYQSTGKYSGDDLHITFIDIQEGAVISLKKLLHVAGLDAYVKDVLLMDAMDYTQRPNENVHLILLEAMQHGFSREGQLALARHFSTMLEPNGLFLPQRVHIQAVLANPQNEFVEQWKDREVTGYESMNIDIKEERILMGTILTVDQALLKKATLIQVDKFTSLLECATLEIPELEMDRDKKVLLFCSDVEIFGEEKVREYDSGITHPLPDLSICINFIPDDKKEEDLYVKSGDRLQFFYRMNGIPGFIAMKVES